MIYILYTNLRIVFIQRKYIMEPLATEVAEM